MTWFLYASYMHREQAEQAFGELLEIGLAAEDLSLVMAATKADHSELVAAANLVDAAQVHPEELRLGISRVQEEGFEGVESAVGGGIATDRFDDDVSGVEEMDDSQDAAENLAEPLQGRWYGLDDIADAERFAEKGTIDATHPDSIGFNGENNGHAAHPVERPYSLNALRRVIVIGDGALSTDVLTCLLQAPTMYGIEALQASLERAGVADAEVRELTRAYRRGGAVLSVAELAGKVPIHEIENLVERTGGYALRAAAKID